MDMKLNSELIKRERENRAWSQQDLAVAAGLGIRTIQRIESGEPASNESAKALAAVFKLQVSQIREETPRQEPLFYPSRKLVAGLISVSLLLGAGSFSFYSSLADSVSLEYTVSIDDQDSADNAPVAVEMGSEILPEGQKATILLEDYKLVVTPSIQDSEGQILLALEVYRLVDGNFELRAQPRVITLDEELATVRSNSNSGNQLSIYLTPTIQ